MWEAVKGILSSKKALVAFLSVLVWVIGKAGLHYDVDQLLPIMAPLWAYIFGQGLADMGKEKAKVDAETAKTLAKIGTLGETKSPDPS